MVTKHDLTCPPCTGHCYQGRACPAREPVTQDEIDEALEEVAADIDTDGAMEQFDGVGWRDLLAGSWPVLLVIAIGAGVALWKAWPWW